MSALEWVQIWVCVDCYMAHHGYDEHELGHAPDREPLSLIGEDCEILSGGEHADDCLSMVDGEWVGETDCDCERIAFTWSACEGCGSQLGGAREALTVGYRQD